MNVAVLSRREPSYLKSHAKLTGTDLGLTNLPPDLRDHPIFRRDCLELGFDAFTLFVCHFKAPHPFVSKSEVVREAEARAVRKIVEARFVDPEQERWIIVGDFNEPARTDDKSTSALAPLKSDFAVDLLDRLGPGTDWTYEVPDTHLHSRPDRIFVSPRLSKEYPDVRPQIIRSGMEPARNIPPNGPPSSTDSEPHASDHALVYADFPGL